MNIFDWFVNEDLDEMFRRKEISYKVYEKIAYTRFELKILYSILLFLVTAISYSLGASLG